MLKFSSLTLTDEGDFKYTTELKLLKVQSEGIEFHEKTYVTRSPHPTLADKMATTEWSWYMRGNAATYVQRCQTAWDNLTNGGAPLMAKPKMDECFDLLKRFTDFLNSDLDFYCSEVCTWFRKMERHLEYVLPPDTHEWYDTLATTLNHIKDACTMMENDIAGTQSILQLPPPQASA